MADLIRSESSKSDPAGRWRPPNWLLVAAAGLILAGAVRSWGGVTGSDSAEPAPSSTAAGDSPSPTREAAFRLDAVTGEAPPDLRLLIGPDHYGSPRADQRPLVLNADGEVLPLAVGAVPAGDVVQLSRLPDATVVVMISENQGPMSATVLPDRGRPVDLGVGVDTVLTAQGGGLLAQRLGLSDGQGLLRSYTAGGTLRWQRPLAPFTQVHRDTPAGLLAFVSSRHGVRIAGGALALLDTRTGRMIYGIGTADQVVASTDRKVAWIPYGCSEWPGHCSLIVTELDTRFQAEYVLPRGRVPTAGAFSPDEMTIALSFTGQHESVADLDPDGYVAVQSLVPGGQFLRLAGLATGAKQSAAVTWLHDGRLLLAIHHPDGPDRLLIWNQINPRPSLLPTSLPPYSAAGYIATLP